MPPDDAMKPRRPARSFLPAVAFCQPQDDVAVALAWAAQRLEPGDRARYARRHAMRAIITSGAFTSAGRFSPLGPGWHQVVRPLTVKRDGSSHLEP